MHQPPMMNGATNFDTDSSPTADATMTNAPRLAGRTAIVTGASRGIGRAIAIAFAREGAAVAVVARSETEWSPMHPGTIHDVVKDIHQAGGHAIAIPADLSQPADVEKLYDVARTELGPIDLLINNAALTVPGRPQASRADTATHQQPSDASQSPTPWQTLSILDVPLKAFRMHFEIGLFASYRLTQLVLPDMIKANRGSIVNISSSAALDPGEGPYTDDAVAGPIPYGCNKLAMHHLTQTVALQMQPYGIAANLLLPSEPVLTPGNLFAAADETQWADAADFAEATVRVALSDPRQQNGCVLWSDDVLHPERGRRGWLR
ncbi:SDR family NAD(P)-dependent oxidoreductase [Mycobacterium sp.]|uniref:SDR family NAD(P)-dependent oxidoreductase n=1 Tax=Mycobacterium sp. TaxID=1785 RepID=UPI003BAE3D67